MIDAQQRRGAAKIAGGGAIDETLHEKTIIYGLLGQALGGVAVDLGLRHSYGTFDRLEVALATAVDGYARRAYAGMDRQSQRQLNQRQRVRMGKEGRPGGWSDDAPGLERLRSGASTWTLGQMLTLRTIAAQQTSGGLISARGLAESWRVSGVLAMVHLNQLHGIDAMTEVWSREDGGDNGKIIVPEMVGLTLHGGLELKINPIKQWPRAARIEPQDGCPITLIQDALGTLHRQSARVAVRSQLIKVLD